MSVSLTALQDEVYRLLNQATTGPLGQVVTASGSVVVSGSQSVTDYLHQGMREVARTCHPIRAVAASILLTAGQGDYRMADYSATYQPTGDAGYTLWEATDVYSGTRLLETREDAIRNQFRDYLATQGGSTYWYRMAEGVIGFYPIPVSGFSMTLYGLAYPPAPSGDSATPWIADDLSLYLFPRYAAFMLAKGNVDDMDLAARAAIWEQEYQVKRAQLQRSIPVQIARFFTPVGFEGGGGRRQA